MTLDELKLQVKKDLEVDDETLDKESYKNQELYAKYLDHKTNFELLLYKAKGDYKILFKDKWEYYGGKADAKIYVTKPFDLNEVLSRVRNLFKWRKTDTVDASETTPQTIDVYRFDDVMVDCPKFQVTVKGELFTLTTMEIQLLRYFLENQGIVLSRSRIMENVWGQSAEITTRTIDNFVMRLRRIIEPDTSKPRYILSVRGTGYKFIKV